MTPTFELLEGRLLLHGTHLIDTSHEQIPDYAAQPDTVTVADGNWFDPAVWSGGVPTADMDAEVRHDIVISDTLPGDFNVDGNVNAADYVVWRKNGGTQQGYDNWRANSGLAATGAAVAEDIHVTGSLSLAPDANSSLTVTTLTVLDHGRLEVGTADSPITGSVNIVFRDAPFDFHFDPQQLGHGLIVIGDATLSVFGRKATSFVEVAQVPLAGDTTIALATLPTGWLPGDELWIADTRSRQQFDASQNERFEIVEVSGSEVTIDRPLAFDHLGSGDFLPHVAHLSGNVTFRSENPDGVRGHIIAMGRADIRVHNAVFDELGRTTSERLDNSHLNAERHPLHVGTNQIGRYTFHLHHVYGREGLATETPQYELVGNRFTDGKRWGVAIHDTHYGLVDDNVIVNFQSAGVVFEDGSELGNRVEGNFIGLVPGSGDGTQGRVGLQADPLGKLPDDTQGLPATHDVGVLWGDGTPENPYRTLGDLGHEGAGIWGRSVSNHIAENVIANSQAGVLLWTRFLTVPPLPAFKGANPHEHGIESNRGEQLGHEFRGNEVYASTTGYNFLGVAQRDHRNLEAEGVFIATANDAWNSGFWAIDLRYCGTIELVGGTLRGPGNLGSALKYSFTSFVVVDGLTVSDFRNGITLPRGTVRNSHLENIHGVAISSRTDELEVMANTFTNVGTEVAVPKE